MPTEPRTTVREIVLRAIHADPIRTVAELAELAECSRQRVQQVLKSEGLAVPSIREVRRARGIKITPTPRVSPNGPMRGISHSAAGTIGEMLAAADLMARGWSVFFPLVRTTKCDLIALSPDGRDMRRIEVRSGKRAGSGLSYNKKKTDICDHYAVVLPDEPITYVPEVGRP